MKLQTIFLFLFLTLPLVGCDWVEEKIAQHKAEKARKYQERYEKSRKERIEFGKNNPIVGNLCGVPVALPRYIVEYVQHDDTPDPFSKEWQTYKRPEKRTYADNLTAFGFVFDFKTNELRDPYANTYKRWEKEYLNNMSSWINVSVYCGRSAPKEDMNQWATTWLPKNGYYYDYKYSKTGEEFGLEKYQFPDVLDKKTQKPIRNKDKYGDVFVSRDEHGNVASMIKCSNHNKYNLLLCDSYFHIPDFNTRITLRFSRPHLEHWKKIQQQAEQHIRSWIVKTEEIQ